MRRMILGATLLLIVASCRKSDPSGGNVSIKFDVPYGRTGISAGEPIRVFASGGEIKDAGILADFNRRDSAFAALIVGRLQPNNVSGIDTLTFISRDRAWYWKFSSKGYYTIDWSGDTAILSNTDTSEGQVQGFPYETQVDYFLPRPNRTLISEEKISNPGSYDIYRYRFILRLGVLPDKKGGFQIPCMVYSWYKGADMYSQAFSLGWIDGGFHKKLTENDTVAVRQYALPYRN